MKVLPFQFEWDEAKADANARKHSVTFELAATNIRLISARKSTQAESRQYQEGL